MCSRFRSVWVMVCGALLLAAGGCSSTVPGAAVPPPGNMVEGNLQSLLQPGPLRPVRLVRNPLAGDAETVEAGKRLFNQFNCSGCHAAGGGAIGPALIDDQWIYGNSAANIFWTLIEGRPGGMPSYGGKISEDQAWRLAAYVRSIANLPAEEEPVATSVPASAVDRGREVFLQGSCVMCHTIRGTVSQSRVGPDLTHVASRKTIAAGTLPNTRGNMAGWILNPQNLKIGTQMPPTLLESRDLQALLTFLESLK